LYALQCGILLRQENPTYMYWAPVAAATRGFKVVSFTASRGNNLVGGTCAPPSAFLVAFPAFHSIPSCIFYTIHTGAAFSSLAFSTHAFLTVSRFPFSHFHLVCPVACSANSKYMSMAGLLLLQ